MAQITNQVDSEKLAYNYMLEQYQSEDNLDMIKKFEAYPIESSDEAYNLYFTSSLRDTAIHELGIGTMHNMNSVIQGVFFPSLRCTVYTQIERMKIWKGKVFAQSAPVTEEISNFNAFNEITKLDVPIYFFAGVYDYTCAYPLQLEYYETVEAPIKEFYTFENSAHSPLFEESDKAMEIITEDILPKSNEKNKIPLKNLKIKDLIS